MPRARIDTSRARRPLDAFNSTQHVIDAISAANNIIVVSGAGISVSCGIPDFRSQNGIYNTLRCEELNLPSPELLFDSEFFSIDPAPFYKFIRNAFPDNPQPSATHHFIRLLEKKKKLLRNYTQNIDGLESAVNINRVVECHGSFSSFRCLTCRSVRDMESCWQDVVNGQVPHCSACNKGFMKPGITFFGDVTSARQLRHLDDDIASCDLLIVIGTSLKVGGVASKILKDIPHHVPQVLINMEVVTPPAALSRGFDVMLLGAADDICTFLTANLGWGNLHNMKTGNTAKKSSREKTTLQNNDSGVSYVTIEDNASNRSFRIRYATKEERLFYESTSSNADAKMQKTRMLTRRKACAIEPKVTTVMLSFDTTIQRSTEKVTVKKTKPRKKRSRKEDLSQQESGSEADSAESECISSTSGTKRQRRVSKFLSRMYVL